jgi:hypothetical protein
MHFEQAATFAGAATILIALIGAVAHVRYLLRYSDEQAWSEDAKQIAVWVVWAALTSFAIGLFSQPSGQFSVNDGVDRSIR